MNPQLLPSLSGMLNNPAVENLVFQASTIKAVQMVNDSGRGPASKVALVYSPMLSGSWSVSAEKSRTFTVGTQIGTEQYSQSLSGSVVMHQTPFGSPTGFLQWLCSPTSEKGWS